MHMTDVSWSIDEDIDGAFTKHDQDITSNFLANLKAKRNASAHGPIGEMMHVASVPVIFIHQWLVRDGFNAYQAPLKDIEARLRREGLTDFLASEKRAY